MWMISLKFDPSKLEWYFRLKSSLRQNQRSTVFRWRFSRWVCTTPRWRTSSWTWWCRPSPARCPWPTERTGGWASRVMPALAACSGRSARQPLCSAATWAAAAAKTAARGWSMTTSSFRSSSPTPAFVVLGSCGPTSAWPDPSRPELAPRLQGFESRLNRPS